ncbi:hypothetical protein [Bosea vestrisii]|uniref:ABC transporter ATP-binding protein n=1 Tax=Bosea vestrisii TaxID=151416 RepID=UPI003D768240
MLRGAVVEAGLTIEILNRPQHAYSRLLIGSVPQLRTGWLEEAVAKEPASRCNPTLPRRPTPSDQCGLRLIPRRCKAASGSERAVAQNSARIGRAVSGPFLTLVAYRFMAVCVSMKPMTRARHHV